MDGHLEVTLLRGEQLKDVEKFGKQDPYCVVSVSSTRCRSNTHTDGGREPVRRARSSSIRGRLEALGGGGTCRPAAKRQLLPALQSRRALEGHRVRAVESPSDEHHAARLLRSGGGPDGCRQGRQAEAAVLQAQSFSALTRGKGERERRRSCWESCVQVWNQIFTYPSVTSDQTLKIEVRGPCRPGCTFRVTAPGVGTGCSVCIRRRACRSTTRTPSCATRPSARPSSRSSRCVCQGRRGSSGH